MTAARAGKGGVGRDVVRVWLLGAFRVSVGFRTVEEDTWRRKKGAGLVQLLALAPGHRMHREELMHLLWPKLGAKAAANNLRQTLYFARRAFKFDPATSSRYLAWRGEQLSLCPRDELWVDVEAFEGAAAAARRSREPAAYRRALELYGGELLPDVRYEEWTERPRARLRQTYLTLLYELSRLHEERGEYGPAIEVLRDVVVEEPLREEAHAGLVRLYALSGERQVALRHYERLRETLSRELGTEPGPASQSLYEEIAAGRYSPDLPSQQDHRRRAPSGEHRHNLPNALTTFVGRKRELLEVKRELAMTRLLTLTGTGGSGKTRLALEVARDLVPAYPDGTWIVELAGLSEGDLMPQKVASALGIREQPGTSLLGILTDALCEKEGMLLILDNCEHLIEACAHLTEALLASCAGLRILATSREPLGVPGELSRPVLPLQLPEDDSPRSVEWLMRYEAVRLFVERARYRNPAFALTPRNTGAVAEICRRLEGIPLAVELAAARVGLSAEQIAERLDDSLGLLTAGSRTATPRQRTLKGALDWSHELLSEPERMLFYRLSVFAGGWTLEAAEAVGAEDGVAGVAVLDSLSRLVEKSLVVAQTPESGAVRYRMLEPIRQYGSKHLEESGQSDTMRRRHAVFFLALAEEAEQELKGPRQGEWLELLEREHDNLRAALSWALERREAELALRLGGALGPFWPMRGHLIEGRQWLEAVLAKTEGQSTMRAKVLANASWIAWEQLDYEGSAALSQEGLTLARESGDQAGAATALFFLGIIAMSRTELERARAMLDEAVALQREMGDRLNLARSLQALGLVAVAQHDYERAATLHDESLALDREMGNDYGVVLSLGQGSLTAVGKGEHERARVLCIEGLEVSKKTGNTHGIVFHLHILAVLSSSQEQPTRSARLWGAAEAISESLGITLQPVERYHYGPYIDTARIRLGETEWQSAREEGKAMAVEQAIEYALSSYEPNSPTARPAQRPAGKQSAKLTRREEEVVALVAQGLTNKQVSERLFVSERTVDAHLRKIFKKLGLRSRAQIAAWSSERRLLATETR